MHISHRIITRIKNDNLFTLNMAIHLSQKLQEDVKQLTIERQAERRSDKLMLPVCIEYYKTQGFTDEEIFEPEAQPAT